jgi:signal transduction histidine kinase
VADLSTLMDDLGKVTQLMLGRMRSHKEQVDVARIAASTAEYTFALPAARGRIFTVAMPPEPLWVQADPEHLRQVLLHLLDHAVTQTRPGDHIWLRAESQPGQVVLNVEDDGIGIPPEALPQVFDLCVSTKCATDRAEVKPPTGLALVRHLIELEGGRVEVSSDGPGAGSEFTVRLPKPPAATAEPEESLTD